jgi:alkaline phosphatase
MPDRIEDRELALRVRTTPYVTAGLLTVSKECPMNRSTTRAYGRIHTRLSQSLALGALALIACAVPLTANSGASAETSAPATQNKKPNIIVIWGDDIGQSDISVYSHGLMGFKTPNIDRVAKEGMMFTDYYAEQSCTAGRASFITGQCGLRTGNTKVGMPGAAQGLQFRDVTIAEMLKGQGYVTGNAINQVGPPSPGEVRAREVPSVSEA